MPTRRGTLFFNPSSGVKLPAAELSAIEAAVTAAGLELIRVTRELDIPATIRERMRENVRLFVAAGGDGTVNCVVQAVAHTEATMAVLPLGTFNHFARDLNIPLDWRAALEIALTGEQRSIDVARVNERFFVNNISLGLYPEMVARREERGRDYPRWKARLYAFSATLRKYPHVPLTVESEHHHEVLRTQMLMVSNNTYDLSRVGIEAPRTTLEEGRLSVYWLPHMPRITLMKFLAHYLAGRVRTTPGFRSFRTQRMKVHSSLLSLRLGIDGELFTMQTPLVITIAPQSLVVKVPRSDSL
jgi:YegS/Rv2252/BmrU family lipid kinase